MRTTLLWLLADLSLFLAACVDDTNTGSGCSVTKVVDGDTLHLTCNGTPHKVRLLGYDTPEIYHPLCAAEKQAGEKATDLMHKLVSSAPVTDVEFKGHDRYGRDLAHVQIGGQDAAAYMLASRLARPYQRHKHPDWCAILGA